MKNNVAVPMELTEAFFKALEKDCSIVCENRVSEKGYYLMDMGENSVHHFEIDGIKDWTWGVWFTKEKGNKYKISFFGDHKGHINKFKPTATAVSISVEVDANVPSLSRDDERCPKEFQTFRRKLMATVGPILVAPKYAYLEYYHPDCASKTKFPLLRYFYFWLGRVLFEPLRGWFHNVKEVAKIKFVKFICDCFYSNKVVTTEYIPSPQLFFPKRTLKIIFELYATTEQILSIYKFKENVKLMDSRIEYHERKEDGSLSKSFYFKEDEEDENK